MEGVHAGVSTLGAKPQQHEMPGCTCARLPSIPLPRLLCPEGNLFPPISISHAIQASAASLLSAECVQYFFITQAVWEILHGSVNGGAGAWMCSADAYWSVLDNNCICV